MSTKEVSEHPVTLERAIKIAIANGWDSFDCTDWWKVYYMYGRERLAVEFRPAVDGMGLFYEYPVIIFNHDFAKALWGEDRYDRKVIDVPARFYSTYQHPIIPREAHTRRVRVKVHGWQHHLQQMVIADDPLRYLADHLPAAGGPTQSQSGSGRAV